MNWKQKTVIRILLLIARIINGDEWLADEIKSLANHISAGDWGKAD
jgi:hypothetical protein